MHAIQALLSNTPLMAAIIAWCVAQVFKAAHAKFLLRDFKMERLVGPGGMPSSHSATVCALAVSIGVQEGFGSAYFALAFALAAIVMYDAVTVRYQAGQHGKALNQIFSQLFEPSKGREEDLQAFKEILGHTPLQVLAGALLGILIGWLMSVL